MILTERYVLGTAPDEEVPTLHSVSLVVCEGTRTSHDWLAHLLGGQGEASDWVVRGEDAEHMEHMHCLWKLGARVKARCMDMTHVLEVRVMQWHQQFLGFSWVLNGEELIWMLKMILHILGC
jgi:hypothetical protein